MNGQSKKIFSLAEKSLKMKDSHWSRPLLLLVIPSVTNIGKRRTVWGLCQTKGGASREHCRDDDNGGDGAELETGINELRLIYQEFSNKKNNETLLRIQILDGIHAKHYYKL